MNKHQVRQAGGGGGEQSVAGNHCKTSTRSLIRNGDINGKETNEKMTPACHTTTRAEKEMVIAQQANGRDNSVTTGEKRTQKERESESNDAKQR